MYYILPGQAITSGGKNLVNASTSSKIFTLFGTLMITHGVNSESKQNSNHQQKVTLFVIDHLMYLYNVTYTQNKNRPHLIH